MRAVQSHDAQGIRAILGGGKELSSSGDESSDKVERELIGRKYLEMHRLVRDSDGTMVLYLGAENWPFPIPLVSENGRWHFDAEAGKEEMLFRRIGENEVTAIQVCEASAMARNHRRASGVSEDSVTAYGVTLWWPLRAVDIEGNAINGRRLNEDAFSVQILDSRGELRSLLKAELRELEVEAKRSTMPSYQSRLTASEREDLIAYLYSLRRSAE